MRVLIKGLLLGALWSIVLFSAGGCTAVAGKKEALSSETTTVNKLETPAAKEKKESVATLKNDVQRILKKSRKTTGVSDKPGPGIKVKRAKKKVSRREDAGFLTVDKKVYDFGTVEPRQQVTGEFMLKNEGSEPLEINKRIRASCGCTKPILKTYHLKPGESVPLTVKYTVGSNPGVTSKKIWVLSEPPALPERLTMSVKAKVKPVVNVTPEEFRFEIRDGTQNNTSLILESTDGIPFRVLSVASRGNAVKAQKYSHKKDTKHIISVKVNPKELKKSPSGMITIKLDHPKLKRVVRRYKAVLPFSAYPSSKSFYNMKPGESRNVMIRIVSNYGQDFQVDKIVSEKGLIKVLKKSKTNDGYQVNISFTVPENNRSKKYIRDNLLITFKDRPEDSLKVPCYNLISSGYKRDRQRAAGSNRKMINRATGKRSRPVPSVPRKP